MFDRYIRKDCKDIVKALMNREDIASEENPGKEYRAMNDKEHKLCNARANAIVSTINLRDQKNMEANKQKALDDAFKKLYK